MLSLDDPWEICRFMNFLKITKFMSTQAGLCRPELSQWGHFKYATCPCLVFSSAWHAKFRIIRYPNCDCYWMLRIVLMFYFAALLLRSNSFGFCLLGFCGTLCYFRLGIKPVLMPSIIWYLWAEMVLLFKLYKANPSVYFSVFLLYYIWLEQSLPLYIYIILLTSVGQNINKYLNFLITALLLKTTKRCV